MVRSDFVPKDVFESIMSLTFCPNFYLSGSCLPVLERTAVQIADFLETKGKLKFKGSQKHFSIKMPYFEETNDAQGFLKRLKECVSISRDYYDFFCGIAILELDEKWNQKGGNRFFRPILQFISQNTDICFFVLETYHKTQGRNGSLYATLSKRGIWFDVETATAPVQECVDAFRELMSNSGLVVSKLVEEKMVEKLNERDEFDMENMDAIYQLAKQIKFERELSPELETTVSFEDIERIAFQPDLQEKAKIGFSADLK